jgi:hypothetical protein
VKSTSKANKVKITIGKKIRPVERKKAYKFVINFMYGDADGEGTEEVYVDKDNPYLEKFITFLKDCKEAYPRGRDGYSCHYNSEKIKNYWLFCETGDELTDKQFEEIEECGISLDWQYDPTNEGYQASFEGYEVTYFDEDGQEYEVKITGA